LIYEKENDVDECSELKFIPKEGFLLIRTKLGLSVFIYVIGRHNPFLLVSLRASYFTVRLAKNM